MDSTAMPPAVPLSTPPTQELARAFLAHCPPRGGIPEGTTLELLLERVLATARRTWSGVRLESARFMRHLAERVPGDDAPLSEVLERLVPADLYLACACEAKDPVALDHFGRVLHAAVPVAVGRLDSSRAFLDEVEQHLWERMLVAGSRGPARLQKYGGLAPLQEWLKAAAYRAAVDLLRAQGPDRPMDEPPAELVALGADPELTYLKAHYQAHFRSAFEQALRTLAARERTVLRLNLVQGLNIERIGIMYGVHRASVARWIAAGRAQLLEKTREQLGKQLRLNGDELDSILRMVASRMDLSLAGFLAATGTEHA
jgi:RNA polymerase sigma-70 factor (ECF subfamily)